jgi:hypothetical protein
MARDTLSIGQNYATNMARTITLFFNIEINNPLLETNFTAQRIQSGAHFFSTIVTSLKVPDMRL